MGGRVSGHPALSKGGFSSCNIYVHLSAVCWSRRDISKSDAIPAISHGRRHFPLRFGIGSGVFAICVIDFSYYAIFVAGACGHFNVFRGTGGGVVILGKAVTNP